MAAAKDKRTKPISANGGGAGAPKGRQTKKTPPATPLMLNGQSWDRAKVMSIVCQRIATSSRSIASILEQGYEGYPLPTYTTIMEWLSQDVELSDKYAKAKVAQADYMAEEMIDIADDARNDYMEQLGKDGQGAGYVINGEHVQRSRLRLETRKWLASKLKPKKYGERTVLAGDEDAPLRAVVTLPTVDQALSEILVAVEGIKKP